jgi:hypothetical protein
MSGRDDQLRGKPSTLSRQRGGYTGLDVDDEWGAEEESSGETLCSQRAWRP